MWIMSLKGLGVNVGKTPIPKSKKDWKDSGYLCIDYPTNVILRAKTFYGVGFIMCSTVLMQLVRSTINAIYGHQYKDWQIDVEAEYRSLDNSFYLSSCRYSNYIQEEFDGKKKKRS